jgi:hypothetical protein
MHTSIFHLHKIPFFLVSSFHKVFGCFLGPRSFDSPERILAHKQTSLPITFGDIELISTSTISPTAYLGSWALVALVIIVRFMVNQRPFLLEALARINNNIFPFQQHLKVARDLLPPPTHVCLPPFEQLIGQQMVQPPNSSQNVYIIIPFPTCSSTRHLRPIVPKFYHVMAQGQTFGL